MSPVSGRIGEISALLDILNSKPRLDSEVTCVGTAVVVGYESRFQISLSLFFCIYPFLPTFLQLVFQYFCADWLLNWSLVAKRARLLITQLTAAYPTH